jgi:hypothetical protein
MADRTIIVLTPATQFDLLTLAECKLLLGLDPNDTTQDAQLQLMISTNSATIAEMCNRTFAQEKVRELWREIGHGRLYLSHWPIKSTDDIESVTAGGGVLDPTSCELEPHSGKLSVYGSNGAGEGHWSEPAEVVYTGGYVLPDEAPLPLKQATAILVREDRLRNQQMHVAGVKQIHHEGRSVSYFDPSLLLRATAGKPPGWQAIDPLLKQFTRIEA